MPRPSSEDKNDIRGFLFPGFNLKNVKREFSKLHSGANRALAAPDSIRVFANRLRPKGTTDSQR